MISTKLVIIAFRRKMVYVNIILLRKTPKNTNNLSHGNRGASSIIIPVQVGDELILVVGHARQEVSDAHISLLRPP